MCISRWNMYYFRNVQAYFGNMFMFLTPMILNIPEFKSGFNVNNCSSVGIKLKKKKRTWVTSVILLKYFSFYDYYQKQICCLERKGTKSIHFWCQVYCTETISGVIISGIILSDFLNGVYNIILKHVQNHLVTKEMSFTRTKSSDLLDKCSECSLFSRC